MSITVTLEKGLLADDQPQTEAELRQLSAGDIIEAGEDSEKLIQTAAGPVLVQSPSLMGAELLRRQIVRIGNIPGPLSRGLLGQLEPADFQKIQNAADDLDTAVLEATVSRGRDVPAQPDAD